MSGVEAEIGRHPDPARGKGEDQHAYFPRTGNHGRRIRCILRHVGNHDVGLDGGEVDPEGRRGRQHLGQRARVGVILREVADMVIQRIQTGCGEEADLAHGSPHHGLACCAAPMSAAEPARTLPAGQPRLLDSAIQARRNGLEISFSYEAVRGWEAKLLPIMGDALRKRRHGWRRGSRVSGHVDATYLKVRGRWCYLYRAIDRHGNLIDAMLIAHRDTKAAKTFFRSARASMGFRPEWVTTDGHGCYPRAIRSVLGRTVRQRIGACLNNRLEQDHRGIKGRHEGQDPTQARLQEPRDRPPLLPRARRTPRSAPPLPPCQPDRPRVLPPRPLRQGNTHRAQNHAERLTCHVRHAKDQNAGAS